MRSLPRGRGIRLIDGIRPELDWLVVFPSRPARKDDHRSSILFDVVDRVAMGRCRGRTGLRPPVSGLETPCGDFVGLCTRARTSGHEDARGSTGALPASA